MNIKSYPVQPYTIQHVLSDCKLLPQLYIYDWIESNIYGLDIYILGFTRNLTCFHEVGSDTHVILTDKKFDIYNINSNAREIIKTDVVESIWDGTIIKCLRYYKMDIGYQTRVFLDPSTNKLYNVPYITVIWQDNSMAKFSN